LRTTNCRASVTCSFGDGGASVIRRLGIAPAKIACTDERTAFGTHKEWEMAPSLAATSARSSVVRGKPERPSNTADAADGSRPIGKRKASRTRLARIFSVSRYSCAAIPAIITVPAPAATTAGMSSLLTCALELPALGLLLGIAFSALAD